MSPVLVAYGSKHGSTAEIAQRIGDVLREQGVEAEVRSAWDVRDVGSYEAVVLGSAIYMARWRREARRLLRRTRRELSERPTWLFSSGPVGERQPREKEERWTTPRLVRRLAPRIGAREHVVFGGRVPLEPRNFVERAMVKNTPPDKRDLRDWDEIAAWARGISSKLHTT